MTIETNKAILELLLTEKENLLSEWNKKYSLIKMILLKIKSKIMAPPCSN